jgi:hypothetical protein
MTKIISEGVRVGQVWADGEDRLTIQSITGRVAEVYVWRDGEEGGHPTSIGLAALRNMGFRLLKDA